MSAVHNIAAIIQKEWRHYFAGPIGYVMFFVWLVLFGLFFYAGVNFFVVRSMNAGMGGGLSINDHLIGPIVGNGTVAVIFLAPMMTMRLFAEEKRQGTIELLGTVPLTDFQIVAGKFLAALGVYVLMIGVGLINMIFIYRYATPTPEWKPILAAVLGLVLFGASYLALGMFLSTLTKNQVVAGVLAFCLCLGLFLLGWFTSNESMGGMVKAVFVWLTGKDAVGETAKEAFAYLSVTKHLDQFVKGVIELKDVVYYVSVIAIGLVLSHQSLASQRWRA